MKCPIGSTNAVHMLNKCAYEAYLLVVESISLNIGFFNRNNEDYIHISRCCRCLGCKTFLKTFVLVYFRNDNPIVYCCKCRDTIPSPYFVTTLLGNNQQDGSAFTERSVCQNKDKVDKIPHPIIPFLIMATLCPIQIMAADINLQLLCYHCNDLSY